ncbi:thiamine biosynthesis lipoprotein [Limimonas halophila]|uniref:FAD:protein FMN transferase n=1 Tax=Limimonas halophila TaxID=1082479 RepID=A0A1G7M9U8_9PROT|nr:FAD:protein FMN transferase [Limimonas halophila]SDF58548.1 thiamine biosynthesis lipoprotein [Limimonas halophila]
MTTRRTLLGTLGGLAGAAVLPWPLAAGERARREPLTFMGVSGRVTLADPGDGRVEAALAQVRRELRRLEAAVSLYDPNSELSRLNRDGRLAGASPALRAVLDRALAVARATDGAFDPTVQPLWELHARFFRDANAPAPPPQLLRERAAGLVDHRRVRVDSDGVAFDRPGMAVTLNGLAQGRATDLVTETLRRHGLHRHLVDLGEFSARAGNDGEPWRVGVAAPAGGRLTLVRTVPLTSGALATSAGYGTPFDAEGRHHHLFDPATGGSTTRHASVSVTAPDAATADALSTAFSAMPTGRIAAVVADRPGLGALVVDHAGAVETFGRFAAA